MRKTKKIHLFNYYGGKTYMVDDIVKFIQEIKSTDKVSTIVDVFGGSGNIILNIPPEWRINRVWNDLDLRLYKTMRCLMNKETREKLIEMFEHTMSSKKAFDDSRSFFSDDSWKEKEDIEVAYNMMLMTILSFNSSGTSFSVRRNKATPLMFSYTEYLKREWRWIRSHVVAENRDFESLIKAYDREDTIFYLDPPYYLGGKAYKHSFVEEDFVRLKKVLDGIKGIWIMNESERDFTFIESIFGKPLFVKDYWNNNKAAKGSKKTKRLEGYWTNYKCRDGEIKVLF